MLNYIKPHLMPVLIVSLFLYSCEIVKTYYVDKEEIPNEKDVEFKGGVPRITGAFLKSKGFVDLKNKNAKIDFQNNSWNLLYNDSNSVKSKIAFDDISLLKVDVARNNYWLVPVLIVSIAAILFITFILSFKNIKM
jgi:hypothetical protein